MAITREKKQQMMADYRSRMANSQAILLTDYRGLTVSHITDLRSRLREVNGGFQVIKNTLFAKVLEEAGIPVAPGYLEGPVAVGYCFGEVPPVARALSDFANETKMLRVIGAILGTEFLDAEGAKALADLPAREVLLAQLLGAIQGPMSHIIGVITAPLRELVQVLQARSEQDQAAAA